ncbi:suppressor of fused domain protein [Olivibacter sp. XZL3]|uniref:suppressor of fused domain protein n=1 Tax=Olivibacter sp. XZL3 TaxID=1735116 RepID=UPI001064780F|nr:suppressor of fused domain protein [Olivibacter sp. XZL3]
MVPSQDNIQLAHAVAAAIGIDPQVYAYHDDSKENSLHILNCIDPLDPKNKIFCTIGLSDYPNEIEISKGKVKNIPIELIIAGNGSSSKWANILSSAGFFVIKNKWTCQPGAVFKNIIDVYHKGIHLKHLLFVEPLMWQEKLEQMKLANKKVHFLLLIPISDAELIYREKRGFDALESLFMEKEIDITNLQRPSVL